MNDSIKLTKTSITTDKVKNTVKLAVISDFHCTNEKKILNHLNQINPDAVLIPGDLVDENCSMKPVERLFEGLKKWPAYFVSGNHEYKKGRTYQSFTQMQNLLDKYQIQCMDNDDTIINLNDEKIWIGGVQDHCSDKMKDADVLDQSRIDAVCSNLSEDKFSILLMHRPEQYQLTERYPVDLLVSGHAHGGQWRLPGVNGLFAPQQGFFPKRAGGLYPMKHGVHLVSRGLAHYWFLPRIMNRREINIIEIKKAD